MRDAVKENGSLCYYNLGFIFVAQAIHYDDTVLQGDITKNGPTKTRNSNSQTILLVVNKLVELWQKRERTDPLWCQFPSLHR